MSITMSTPHQRVSLLKRYAWLFLPLVAIGGLWVPKLGLLLIPVMVTLMVMGFLQGKYWCGNVCPHGSLFDGVLPHFSRQKKLPAFLRSPIVAGILLFWFMVMLVGRLSAALASWGQVGFWDKLGLVFVLNYFVVTLIGTVLALAIKPRAWCLVCPMGTSQRLLYRLASRWRMNQRTDVRLSRLDDADCRSCRLCDQACPVELEPYHGIVRAQGFEHDLCIRCRSCSERCPAQVLAVRKAS